MNYPPIIFSFRQPSETIFSRLTSCTHSYHPRVLPSSPCILFLFVLFIFWRRSLLTILFLLSLTFQLMTNASLSLDFRHLALSWPSIFIISLLIPLMAHEYVLYVTFVASKIILRHPNRDASKNVSTPTVSEFYEILRAS